MIKAVELFSPDTSRFTDFKGVPVSQIFNASVVAQSQRLEQAAGLLDAPVAAAAPQQEFTPSGFLSPSQSDAFDPLGSLPPLRDEPAVAAYPSSMTTPSEDYNSPLSAGSDPADFIFESEARRDKQGRLQVYTPPSGDGGGAFEVAGITAKYQPKEAAKLKALLDAGDSDGAETYAKEFYRKRAAPFTRFTDNPGLQLQLADTVHHRGEGGLRRVLQRATGSDAKDYSVLIGELSKRPGALDDFNQARQGYEWDEVDRGRASRKKFRQGLENRFNKADAAARKLLAGS